MQYAEVVSRINRLGWDVVEHDKYSDIWVPADRIVPKKRYFVLPQETDRVTLGVFRVRLPPGFDYYGYFREGGTKHISLVIKDLLGEMPPEGILGEHEEIDVVTLLVQENLLSCPIVPRYVVSNPRDKRYYVPKEVFESALEV